MRPNSRNHAAGRPGAEGLCGQAEKVRITRIGRAGFYRGTAVMVHETPVTIRLNGRAMVRTHCLPRQLDAMALGFLVCEGLLLDPGEVTSVRVDHKGGCVEVTASIPDSRLLKQGFPKPSSDIGSTESFMDRLERQGKDRIKLDSKLTVCAGQLLRLGSLFNRHAGLYPSSRYVHSAALSDGRKIICHCEDVGRHNAIDKVIGCGFLRKVDFSNTPLLCSGRFSLEMVAKAASVGIPVYISPAAASIEAARWADRIGMTLCGCTTAGKANIYSALWRIKQ